LILIDQIERIKEIEENIDINILHANPSKYFTDIVEILVIVQDMETPEVITGINYVHD
jgi:hypothetical protein|tara:strand:+ start:1902 stop:2075 length:174 start_codon:yes stop_codon:yes gene_type:complete